MKRIIGGCGCFVVFIQLRYVFCNDVFTMFSGKLMGTVSVFYDRELPLPTWRAMMVHPLHPFSLRWWSQLVFVFSI